MTLWKSISEINNRKFDATGDVKFALISLAADAKLPARPQPRAIPATAEDFRDELLNIQDSGGPVDDPVQKIIGRATASWLLDKTKTLKSETPIFRHKFPRSPLDGLISTLLPYDKLSVDSLRKELLSQKYPTVDIEQQVKELAETNSFVTNALTFVISIAFSSVLKQYLIKNPLLFLMDDDLVKNAGPEDSKKKFNYRSPRLSDLIDALNIIHGKYMIEYNQSVMADMLQSSPDEKLLFPMGAPASAKKTLDKSPSQIILLKAAYIKYYTELQRALFDYCASNPLEIGNKTISRHTGEVLTPNTYLNLNINDPRDIKGIVDLTPKEKKLSDLNIDMTLYLPEI